LYTLANTNNNPNTNPNPMRHCGVWMWLRLHPTLSELWR